MLNKLKNKKINKNEEGFTLLELVIVIVVIGILAAIAIPIFSSQQNNTSDATLKQDLRNAALTMVTERTKTQKFPAYLPASNVQSPNNQIYLDTANSNSDAFCLVGTNVSTKTTLYYSSDSGKVSGSNSACSSTLASSGNPRSFQIERSETLSGKKALIVIPSGQNSSTKKAVLEKYGYTTVDVYKQEELTSSIVSDYDFYFLDFQWWVAPSFPWVTDALNAGKPVLVSGNDTNSSRYYMTAGTNFSAPGGYTATYNQGLTPSFPYLFTTQAWGGNDSFRCVTEANAVSLATTQVDDTTCITMYGKNVGNGRFIYMSYANNDAVLQSALNWLTAS